MSLIDPICKQTDSKSLQPLVSIITINRNNACGLRATLTSIGGQTYRDYEQVVVDGNSTDNSCEVLRDPSLKVDQWVSEPDTGVYDAQNKGVRMASGRFLLFLNSGDHFIDSGSLERAVANLDSSDLQAFDIVVRGFNSEGNNGADIVKRAPQKLSFLFFVTDTLPHQSTFIRRDLFEKHGYYDTKLTIVADWKAFMIWACRHNCSYRHHPIPLSVFYGDGLSSRLGSVLGAEREHVLAAEFPAFLDDAGELHEGRAAALQLKALRRSRIIRLLKKIGLLWDF